MLLPVVFAIGFFTIILIRESGEFQSIFEYFLIIVIFGVFYLFVVPLVSIWFTAKDLFSLGDSSDRDRDMNMVQVLKLFEHIGTDFFKNKIYPFFHGNIFSLRKYSFYDFFALF